MTDPIPMTINGEAHLAEDTFDVIDPATEEVFAPAPKCTPAQLDLAFESAARAQRRWRHDDRSAALAACGAAIDAHADELGLLLTSEQGKPLPEAVGEVRRAAMWFEHFAKGELPVEVLQDDDVGYCTVTREPLGVVAAIAPWNVPITLASWKVAPALLAGNTMVLKPSPFTPLATLRLGQILAEVLPPGVLNVVSGTDELGPMMTAHPIPRKISFTGSVPTGKRVAASAAADLKRVTLELGGNDPAIVLDDADVDRIADRMFLAAFHNNGQVCSAIKRVYTPSHLYQPLVDALAERAASAKVGDGREDGVRFGPMNNLAQLELVSELVQSAVDDGAEAVTGGGRRPGRGYFYPPTILRGAANGMRIVDEEQFGPALPVVEYDDLDATVDLLNDSMFGLGASVWGADADRAQEVADRLEVGNAWVNTHLQLGPHQPFGGVKWSGQGVENSIHGVLGFTDIKVNYRQR